MTELTEEKPPAAAEGDSGIKECNDSSVEQWNYEDNITKSIESAHFAFNTSREKDMPNEIQGNIDSLMYQTPELHQLQDTMAKIVPVENEYISPS